MVMAVATSIIALLIMFGLHSTDAQIGVCYGTIGDNLPSAKDVVSLYKSNGIGAMRLYAPNEPILKALQGTNIKVMLGVPNEDIRCIATNQQKANDWVQTYVFPYATTIIYIAVGNEIHPSDPEASYVEPAMQNILSVLNSKYKGGSHIKVSTAIDMSLIKNSYPPSQAKFKNLTYITPILNCLTTNDAPLLANIQPYIAYINDKNNVTLEYALFTARGTVVTDGKNQYNNLFDAMCDAVYTAIQEVVTPRKKGNNNSIFDDNKANKKKLKVVHSESGWPSNGGKFAAMLKTNGGGKIGLPMGQPTGPEQGLPPPSKGGENVATLENAKTFYTNLIKHIKEGKGTPLNPGITFGTYLFAMFDEDKKTGDSTEHYYGLFTPYDQRPKYGQLNF